MTTPRRSLARRLWPGWERISRLILAFLIAALLWFYVLNLENPAGSANYNRIPITPRGLAGNLRLANELGTATITVGAPADVLARLSATDFVTAVDLTGRSAGTYRVPVEVVPPTGVTSAAAEPAVVAVQIEEVAERTLAVQVRALGRPGLGYRIETQQVRPTQVVVRGRKDAVAQIDALVAEVDVEGKQGTQAGDVRPKVIDFAGHEITGVDFNPQYVNVTIAIQQLLGYKTLPIRVPVEGAPAPGYRVTDIAIAPTTLTAYGLPAVLEPLNSLETLPLSINGATQTVTRDISVTLTNSLTLYPPGTSNLINVRVSIEEISTKTSLSVLLDRTGLAPGLTTVESPDRVDVTLSGPFDALQTLKPDSVRATLDLSSYGEGTHRITPAITLPPHTTLKGVDPPAVTVTISSLPTPTATATPTALPPPTATLPPPTATLPAVLPRVDPAPSSPYGTPVPVATPTPIPTLTPIRVPPVIP